MEIKKFSLWKRYGSSVLGIVSGALNGLFGSGGGIAVVPMLELLHLPPQKAHATSVAIIFPLSLITTIFYLWQDVSVQWLSLCWLIPGGLLGSLLGAKLLRKIQGDLLRRIFGGIILYAGVRLLLS